MAELLAPLEVIERTRRGGPVDAVSTEAFVRSWSDGTTPDALMAAWCMAVCLVGLGDEQVEALCRALIASGDRLDLASLGPTGDIASTGGVGDSAPLVAAPIAAALGVNVAGLGSRALGHAGGTLDKLESIAGFEADLPLARFVRQIREVGIAVTSQPGRLTPAAWRLDTLRDATGTTPAAGLVAASVMSRAIACGSGALVLDIAWGEGGHIADEAAARATATLMSDLAAPWGRAVRWLVSDMSRPRGRCVGNALEVREAGEVLCGRGPEDVRDLATRLAGDLAEAAGVLLPGEGAAAAEAALANGRALRTAERWVEAQGGDPAAWSEPGALPSAPERIDVPAADGGWVAATGARGIGEAARWLGAGRLHPDQSVDPIVGVELTASIGQRVEAGDPLAVIHARDRWAGERAGEMVAACVVLSPDAPALPATILGAGGA